MNYYLALTLTSHLILLNLGKFGETLLEAFIFENSSVEVDEIGSGNRILPLFCKATKALFKGPINVEYYLL